VTVETLEAIYDGIPEDVYHSGEWLPEPSLSVSAAKRLLRTSPARFKWEQQNKPRKQAFDFGHAAHAKVLGVGAQVDVIPADLLSADGGVRSKAAKEWAAEREAAGVAWLKPADMDVIDAMATQLEEHATARALLTSGTAEQSLAYRDPETHILLRGRTDWLTTYRDTPVAVDYKTTDDANPDEFRWAARKFDYHMQDSWYREMLDALTGTPHGFLFIAQEKTEPYLVSVVQLDHESRERGHERNQRARAIWLDCMTRDEWPAHPGITTINVP
jgi:hypothetical protein